MNKHIYILLALIIPGLAFAQVGTNKEKAAIASRVDSLVQQYILTSSLADPGANSQNIKVIRDFKALFASNATIFDDINVEYKSDETDFPYVLKTKSLLEYIDEIVTDFPDGLHINTKNVMVSYANIDKGEVQVYIAHMITGTKSKGDYQISNDDTLLLNLIVQADQSIKISRIESVSNSLKIQNDNDLDGVVNAKDECIDQKGPIELKGCPDDDGDGIPNRLDDCPDVKGSLSNNGCPGNRFAYKLVLVFSAGYMMNQNNLSEPTSGFGYTLLDMSQAGTGSKIENPGFEAGPAINAHVGYYFGNKNSKKNKGISLGVNYGNFVSTYGVGNSKYFYMARDGGENEYWRMVTINAGSSEEVSYTMMNISLLFRIKGKFGSRFAAEFGIGPSYISYTGQSTFSGSINYEGIYQYDKINGTLLTNGLQHYTYDTHDWLLVHDPSHPANFDPAADSLFVLLNNANTGYDFVLNSTPVNAGKKIKTDIRSGLALNAVVDLYYHIKPRVAIKFGVGFIYSALGNTPSASYRASDKSNDAYNSILNSTAKSTNMSFGGNLGIMIGFGLGGK